MIREIDRLIKKRLTLGVGSSNPSSRDADAAHFGGEENLLGCVDVV
jgi:hypothetical protein